MKFVKRILMGAMASSSVVISAVAFAAFPDGKPITLVCSTSPGSGAAAWCQMMAAEMAKSGNLAVPVNVLYKPGGANNEAVVYTYTKPANGYTVLHLNGSYTGYFNLQHYTYGFDKIDLIARVERHIYAIAARCDDPELKSWQDVVKFAKAHPGELVMGSGKPGSLQHRNHIRINKSAGINIGFVPYQGTGGVVKDVVGGHLRIGMAQPRQWGQFIEAGTICPLFLQNETRLDRPLWKDVPTASEVGLNYKIAHQWQGIAVKKGTPPAIEDALATAAENVTEMPAYQIYLKQEPHVIRDFDRNRKQLRLDFLSDLGDAREFMLENKLITK